MFKTTSGPSSAKKNNPKATTELLYKGVLCALIGLAVLISPAFIASAEMRSTIASSSLVGWFALVLGGAFLAQYAARLWAAKKRQQPR